jgi:hypothetical protein
MAKTPGGRNITSAVRETLDSVVTPSVRDTILARALALANRSELPSDPRELEDFLQGALHDALIKALGPELGLSVSLELERMAAVATHPSGTTPQQAEKPVAAAPPKALDTVRPGARTKVVPTSGRRKPRSTLPSPEMSPLPGSVKATDARWAEKERRAIAPTEPAGRRVQAPPPARPPSGARDESIHAKGAPLPVSADYPRGVAKALGVIGTASVEPRASQRPTVLLASTDPELLRLFKAWLDMRAAVELASGATGLIVRLAEVGGPRAVIVLDGKNPGIRPLTLAALADELPAGTTVILWGVQPHLHARMCTISALAEKWLVYAGDATSTEVVAQCAKLMG